MNIDLKPEQLDQGGGIPASDVRPRLQALKSAQLARKK
jgi:hypothetical protein